MDFLVVDYEGPVMLLHNRSQTKNHWIMFDLRGAGPNRFAYGAQIFAQSGQQIWKAQVSPSSSYLSTEDPRVHLGLGSVELLDTVTIRHRDDGRQERIAIGELRDWLLARIR